MTAKLLFVTFGGAFECQQELTPVAAGVRRCNPPNTTMNDPLHQADEMRFHKRSWIVQRIGWSFMALFILSALLGLFGSGWLSQASSRDHNVQVEFERFGRVGSDARLRILVFNPAESNLLILAGTLLDNARIDRITPQPVSAVALSNGISFWIAAPAGAGVAQALIDYTPTEPGTLRASLQVGNATAAEVKQFVYP